MWSWLSGGGSSSSSSSSITNGPIPSSRGAAVAPLRVTESAAAAASASALRSLDVHARAVTAAASASRGRLLAAVSDLRVRRVALRRSLLELSRRGDAAVLPPAARGAAATLRGAVLGAAGEALALAALGGRLSAIAAAMGGGPPLPADADASWHDPLRRLHATADAARLRRRRAAYETAAEAARKEVAAADDLVDDVAADMASARHAALAEHLAEARARLRASLAEERAGISQWESLVATLYNSLGLLEAPHEAREARLARAAEERARLGAAAADSGLDDAEAPLLPVLRHPAARVPPRTQRRGAAPLGTPP